MDSDSEIPSERGPSHARTSAARHRRARRCSPTSPSSATALRNAAFGLTDEQARLTPTREHAEHRWAHQARHADGARLDRPDRAAAQARPGEDQADYASDFRSAPDETLAERARPLRRGRPAETEAVVAGIADLDQPVPVPKGVPWFPDDVEAWSVRWVLLHLIEEIARHAGHADIVRESIDGATHVRRSWPPPRAGRRTDWLQPWQPPPRSGSPP